MPNTQNTERKRRNILILNFFLVTIAIGGIAYFAYMWFNVKPIKTISVSGSSYIPQNEILENISDTLIHRPIQQIDYKEILERVKENPLVDASYISQRTVDEINISIQEREPIALLVKSNGDLALLDANLNVLPYIIYNELSDLYILRNFENDDKFDSLGLAGVFELIQVLNQPDNLFVSKLISEIKYIKTNKSYEFLIAQSPVRILFGRIEDLQNKLDKVKELFASGLLNSKNINYADLRWVNQIIINEINVK